MLLSDSTLAQDIEVDPQYHKKNLTYDFKPGFSCEMILPFEPLHQSFFGIFEIGSRELFAQAGFKLQSS
jgi:hypothetical protein